MLTDYGNDKISTGLMQYLAVLGIDTQKIRLRNVKNYLYILAGVVYCTPVLAVEKLLPVAARDDQTEGLALARQWVWHIQRHVKPCRRYITQDINHGYVHHDDMGASTITILMPLYHDGTCRI